MKPNEQQAILCGIVHPACDMITRALAILGKDARSDAELSELFRKLQMTFAVPATATTTSTLQQLRNSITAGNYETECPPGTIISDHWSDVYTEVNYYAPHVVTGFQTVKLPDGMETLGAILVRQNAMPEKLNFPNTVTWLSPDGAYARGCSKELLEAVAPTTLENINKSAMAPIMCAASGFKTKWQPETFTFFLPTQEELGLSTNPERTPMDAVWTYYKNTPTGYYELCIERIFRDSFGIAQDCWLYPAVDGFIHMDKPQIVLTNGGAGLRHTFETASCAPACIVVGADAKLQRDKT